MFRFSKEETIDLSIAILVITLIFTFIFTRSNFSVNNFLYFLPISLITVGLSFILHELGHKFVAQRYGFYAEFRRSDRGLIFAFITALLGFVFLAPGAVYIGSPYGYITDEENGKISIAGPVVNLILAVIFYGINIQILSLLTPGNIDFMTYLYYISALGFSINSFLALFNLLPIPPLDGSKVIKWNLPIWLITIAISGIFTYAAYML